MALFFDYRVDAPNNEETRLVSWCKSQPIMAVATDDNRIQFYQDEGELVENCEIGRKCNASAMEWQPRGKLLAIGWSDGT